jgi:hypothetical protein
MYIYIDNTIIIVLLIAVVIYLIFQSSPSTKEDFGWRNDTCKHPATRPWMKMMLGCR